MNTLKDIITPVEEGRSLSCEVSFLPGEDVHEADWALKLPGTDRVAFYCGYHVAHIAVAIRSRHGTNIQNTGEL